MARVIRSPYSHANFFIGDLTYYKEHNPGITCVLTARDIPGENCFGVIEEFSDQPILAETKIRYPGEAIAVVVGSPDAVKKLDLDKFPVRWEVLEPLITMDEAQAEGALLLHKNRKNNGKIEKTE